MFSTKTRPTNRALAVFSTLLSWAEKRRMRAGNPCSGVARSPERLVNRYPTPAEIAVLLRAVDELAAEGRVTPHFAAGLRAGHDQRPPE